MQDAQARTLAEQRRPHHDRPHASKAAQMASCFDFLEHVRDDARTSEITRQKAAMDDALERADGDHRLATAILANDAAIDAVNRTNKARLDAEDNKRSEGQEAFYRAQREAAERSGVTHSTHEAARRGGLKAAAQERERRKAAGLPAKRPRPVMTDDERIYKNWAARRRRARRRGLPDPELPEELRSP